MKISKKLFVLLLAAMVLATLASVTLVVTGHEQLVRDAFRWATSSAESVAEVLAIVAVVIFASVLL